MKNLVIFLSVACVLLIVAYVSMWYRCAENERFKRIGTTNISTYVMFDNKTAQACWSGPADEAAGLHIPSCKDLK